MNNAAPDDSAQPIQVSVFRGTRAACAEFSLVLEARNIPHELRPAENEWQLAVGAAAAAAAREELARYDAERIATHTTPAAVIVPYSGAGLGVAGYAAVLLVVAYCAGGRWLGLDWLAAGALDARAGGAGDWWRAFTALTLHLDQAHLLGNLLFGAGFGWLAGRLFGPGVAWASILFAGAVGNYADMLISPASHRAAGASTAVFAALGLVAGFAWGQALTRRERIRYRWAPLFGGLGLLVLLGAGGEHIDVLGHLLGFLAGIALGGFYARIGMTAHRGSVRQLAAGAAALIVVELAWVSALR